MKSEARHTVTRHRSLARYAHHAARRRKPIEWRLGLESLEPRLLLAGTRVFIDADGDAATAKLVGPGSLLLSDPDGNGVHQLDLSGTNTQSSRLSVTVRKSARGDGLVSLDAITGTGVKALAANAVDLVGSGIDLAGTATQKTTVAVHVVGAGAAVRVGSSISKLSAAAFRDSQIVAPSIGSLLVAGDRKRGIVGDFAADIQLNGTGVAAGKPTLATVAIAGTADQIAVNVNGNIESFTVARLVNSTVFAGYTPADPASPLGGGRFTAGRIGAFVASGLAGAGAAFERSVIAADIVGRVTLESVATANAGMQFGVVAGTSVQALTVSRPVFQFNPAINPHGIEDFVVFVQPPSSPSITGIDHDSGLAGDGITNDSTLTVSGVSLAHSTVTLLLDGVSQGEAAAGALGMWSFPLPAQQSGSYVLTATARDRTGRTSEPSAPFAITIDARLPVLQIPNPAAGRTTTNVTMEGTASDADTGVVHVEFQLDSAPFQSVPINGLGEFQFSTGLPLDGSADGLHTITVRAGDVAGNSASVSGGSFTLDTRPPVFTIHSPSLGVVASTNVTVTGVVQDALSGVASLQARFDSDPARAVDVGVDGAFSFLTDLPLDGSADGLHHVYLTATDGIGNRSTVDIPFTLRARPPAGGSLALAINAPVADAKHSHSARLIGSAGVSAIRASYSLNGSAPVPLVLDIAGGFDQPLSGTPLEIGWYQVVVSASDSAGNSVEQTIVFTVSPSFTLGSAGTQGWGYATGDSLRLEERDSFLVQTTVPVSLGGVPGSRTIRFTVNPDWAVTDSTLSGDRLLVYLVDPDRPNETLLASGAPGTPLLTITDGAPAEFLPGLVHFNGVVAQIDVTSLSDHTNGLLKFQLLNGDGDTGSSVRVAGLSSVLDTAGVAGPVYRRAAAGAVAPGPALGLASLSETPDVAVLISNVRVDAGTGEYRAELRVRNDGSPLGRDVVVVFNDLAPGVTLTQASGTTAGGAPYLNLRPAILGGGLTTGDVSLPVSIRFTNPNQARFSLTPTVRTGVPNRAPFLNPVAPVTVAVGERLVIPLTASDPDGDPIEFFVRGGPFPGGTLEADGTLVIEPVPGEQGGYIFTAVASDSVLDGAQLIVVTVSGVQSAETGISGVIADSEGNLLAGVPVELGGQQTITAADGTFALTFTGALPDEFLIARGSAVSGTWTYSDAVEPLSALSDRPIYPGYRNVLDRPLYLTAFDPAHLVHVQAGVDTVVTSPSDPGFSLMVRAGSLVDEFGNPHPGPIGIRRLDPKRTPGAVPKDRQPNQVFAIHAPMGVRLSQSAQVRVPNTNGHDAAAPPRLLPAPNPLPTDNGEVSPDGSSVDYEIEELDPYYFVVGWTIFEVTPYSWNFT